MSKVNNEEQKKLREAAKAKREAEKAAMDALLEQDPAKYAETFMLERMKHENKMRESVLDTVLTLIAGGAGLLVLGKAKEKFNINLGSFGRNDETTED